MAGYIRGDHRTRIEVMRALNACACMQVLATLPISSYVAGFYAHHPGFCSMLLNTAFSLAAALFVFIILPAGDFVLGEEPPEAVSSTVNLRPS